MINKSLGVFKEGTKDPINLPPVPLSPTNVCAAAALSRKIINIEDVSSSGYYDFSGPRKYDAMTGYRTRSVMVVPMEDISGEVIGVLQRINALDPAGRLISLTVQDEEMVNAIASQAGVCISNIAHEKM
ncbi:MAG: GAF domain-containing protein [[Clostridium] aminophilum]|uniref:GAF domain-containing protein n=1 Tax=[Clostridium] aminophilum TaxID=1526 RepID=UPI0026EE0E4D|nr:GAF domain-containing protein [[Clostridium] aminophilum]MDD6196012.1 GAF domain-containing protein [[Clostridium] aminophilum]